MVSARARSASSSTNSSCAALPTTIAREHALHFWPARPNAARATPSAALSRSARSLTIAGFLPPISVSAGRAKAPSCSVRPILRPTCAEPVNAMPSTAEPTSARPAAGPPWTRLNTPSGSPPARTTSASSAPVHGASSEGFSTTVLPAISAADAMLTASAIGKLKGEITPKTPYGRSTSVFRSPSTKLASGTT